MMCLLPTATQVNILDPIGPPPPLSKNVGLIGQCIRIHNPSIHSIQKSHRLYVDIEFFHGCPHAWESGIGKTQHIKPQQTNPSSRISPQLGLCM